MIIDFIQVTVIFEVSLLASKYKYIGSALSIIILLIT